MQQDEPTKTHARPLPNPTPNHVRSKPCGAMRQPSQPSAKKNNDQNTFQTHPHHIEGKENYLQHPPAHHYNLRTLTPEKPYREEKKRPVK
mmetsp:Transcript_16542/g.24320  ORF Transcript_16542/g.24320 Transcript_16542/m.24320 type:complete len:90 (+) Transcript_16542:212-481(+)